MLRIKIFDGNSTLSMWTESDPGLTLKTLKSVLPVATNLINPIRKVLLVGKYNPEGWDPHIVYLVYNGSRAISPIQDPNSKIVSYSRFIGSSEGNLNEIMALCIYFTVRPNSCLDEIDGGCAFVVSKDCIISYRHPYIKHQYALKTGISCSGHAKSANIKTATMATLIRCTIFTTIAGAFRETRSIPFPHGTSFHRIPEANSFSSSTEIKRDVNEQRISEEFTSRNNWGFSDPLTEWPDEEYTSKLPKRIDVRTTTPYYEEIDPHRNGLLKDIGSIDVGFGVGVGVPGNDPVSVGTKVGVGFGASGLAGGLPIGENIFPRQGEWQSLNDYDGNKRTIVPGKAGKYIRAVMDGRIRVPHYRPATSLVGVRGNIGIGTGQ